MGPNQREVKRRLRILKHAEKIGNVHMTCRYFGLARSTFYRWKSEYDKHGEAGLVRKSAASINHPRKTPAEIVEKIVHLRRKYHLGPIRIVWYLLLEQLVEGGANWPSTTSTCCGRSRATTSWC